MTTKASSPASEPAEFTLRKIRCGHQESFLSLGSQGPSVRELQRLLNDWAKLQGLELEQVCGTELEQANFGKQTLALLKIFQERVSIHSTLQIICLDSDSPGSHTLKCHGQLDTLTLCALEWFHNGSVPVEIWDRVHRATVGGFNQHSATVGGLNEHSATVGGLNEHKATVGGPTNQSN